MEVRYGGVDILADPGTYCYHGEPEWRKYFQSTIGHNTLEIDGQWQSVRGGAFLWLRHAHGREMDFTDDGHVVRWVAEHDGYHALRPSAAHQRSVRLHRVNRTLEITDEINGGNYHIRMAYHLGPLISVELDDSVAELSWPGAATPEMAHMELPAQLRWHAHHGETRSILGWFSAGLGQRVPAVTLIGEGISKSGVPLSTQLRFAKPEESAGRTASRQAIPLCESSRTSERSGKPMRRLGK